MSDSLFTGTFKLVSHQGMEPLLECMKDAGLPAEVMKKAMSPDNEMLCTASLDNGFCCVEVTNSLCPELNSSFSGKIGEEIEVKVPIPQKFTISRKGDDTLVINSESAMGKAVATETFNNFGITVNGCFDPDGKALKYKQVFERVASPIEGYYVFDKEENMEAFIKETMPGTDINLVKKAMQASSMKVKKCGDVLSFEECFGGGLPTKKMSCKLDEQFRYEQKAFNEDYNVIISCGGPGILTSVMKNNINGKLSEWTYNFTSAGVCMEGVDKTSGLKCKYSFKRSGDWFASWRQVTVSNEVGYLAAAGMPAAMIKEMCGRRLTMTFSREGDDMVKMTTTDPMMPDLTYRLGEQYSFTQQIPGVPGGVQCTGISVQTSCNEMSTVMKAGDLVVNLKGKVTDDFMITSCEVEGKPGSLSKSIFVRC